MNEGLPDTFLPLLEREVGKGLVAVYRFPGYGAGYFLQGLPESKLLLVLDDISSLHQVRRAFLALPRPQQRAVEQGPMVTTRPALDRHLQLNPLFAYHLTGNGRLLAGEALLPPLKRPHYAERLAYLAQQTIDVSAILAPALLSPRRAALLSKRLQQLLLFLSEEIPDDTATEVDRFALLQQQLERRIDELPLGTLPDRPQIPNPETPYLQAMYEDRQFLLVLIPPPAAQSLRQIEWSALASRMPAHLTSLAVSSARQLWLTIQSERPLDYVLSCFRHIWGHEPLQRRQVSDWAVFRQAARTPSQILLDGLPSHYVLAPDQDTVHKIVHDYQNRLLNMRLEHELLVRLHGLESADPPEPLPRRDEPNDVRIDAIIKRLDWWTIQYTRKMQEQESGQKMSPP